MDPIKKKQRRRSIRNLRRSSGLVPPSLNYGSAWVGENQDTNISNLVSSLEDLQCQDNFDVENGCGGIAVIPQNVELHSQCVPDIGTNQHYLFAEIPQNLDWPDHDQQEACDGFPAVQGGQSHIQPSVSCPQGGATSSLDSQNVFSFRNTLQPGANSFGGNFIFPLAKKSCEMTEDSCGNEVSEDICLNKKCEDSCVNKIPQDGCVNEISEDGHVHELCEDSCVNETSEDDCVNETSEGGHVNELPGNICVNETSEDGRVNEMCKDSCLNEISEDGCVNQVIPELNHQFSFVSFGYSKQSERDDSCHCVESVSGNSLTSDNSVMSISRSEESLLPHNSHSAEKIVELNTTYTLTSSAFGTADLHTTLSAGNFDDELETSGNEHEDTNSESIESRNTILSIDALDVKPMMIMDFDFKKSKCNKRRSANFMETKSMAFKTPLAACRNNISGEDSETNKCSLDTSVRMEITCENTEFVSSVVEVTNNINSTDSNSLEDNALIDLSVSDSCLDQAILQSMSLCSLSEYGNVSTSQDEVKISDVPRSQECSLDTSPSRSEKSMCENTDFVITSVIPETDNVDCTHSNMLEHNTQMICLDVSGHHLDNEVISRPTSQSPLSECGNVTTSQDEIKTKKKRRKSNNLTRLLEESESFLHDSTSHELKARLHCGSSNKENEILIADGPSSDQHSSVQKSRSLRTRPSRKSWDFRKDPQTSGNEFFPVAASVGENSQNDPLELELEDLQLVYGKQKYEAKSPQPLETVFETTKDKSAFSKQRKKRYVQFGCVLASKGKKREKKALSVYKGRQFFFPVTDQEFERKMLDVQLLLDFDMEVSI